MERLACTSAHQDARTRTELMRACGTVCSVASSPCLACLPSRPSQVRRKCVEGGREERGRGGIVVTKGRVCGYVCEIVVLWEREV